MIPGYETVDHDKIERMLAARLESLGIPAEALDAPVSDSSTPPIPGGSYAASARLRSHCRHTHRGNGRCAARFV